jgi:sodium-dependent dicarboxylate transporter 2/3/5
MTKLFGKNVRMTILALMTSAALVSSFISNIPATALFVTLGISFLQMFDNEGDRKKTGKPLMIGIPVAAMIGGIMTPVGSSVNVTGLTILEQQTGTTVSFIQWALCGTPIALLLLPFSWFIITTIFKPAELDREKIRQFIDQVEIPAKMERQEIIVLVVTLCMLVLWVASSWITDINIVMVAIGGVCVFFIPGIKILKWKDFSATMSWDAYFITATVISLGGIIMENGVSSWLVEAVFPGNIASPVLFAFVTALFIFIMLLIVPISGALVTVIIPPLVAMTMRGNLSQTGLVVTVCICATNCYLVPLDTVPLLSYATGYYSFTDMPRATVFIQIMLAILAALWLPLTTGFFRI